MHQRIALIIGAISAAVVLAAGLTAAGFAPGPVAVGDDQSATEQLVMLDSAVEQATPKVELTAPKVEPKTVYVKPAPKRRTVVVTQSAPVARSTVSRSQQAKPSRSRSAARPRQDHEEREHDLEVAAERRKDAAERAREAAKQRREHEREDD